MPGEAHAGVTWRNVLFGLLVAAALVAVTPHNDYIVGNTYIAGNHFPVGAVAVLLLLSVLNYGVFGLRGRPLLSVRETAVVYIIVMVTSGIPSTGLLRYLLPCGTTPYYFASPGNQWEQLFWDRIPTWMAIPDFQASASCPITRRRGSDGVKICPMMRSWPMEGHHPASDAGAGVTARGSDRATEGAGGDAGSGVSRLRMTSDADYAALR